MRPTTKALEGAEVGPGETLDHLCGNWRILQLRAGHRFSTDDLFTAWEASRARPDALRLLDLGAGIGSVGLLALWHMSPAARLTMVEAQAKSHHLARRTIALNGLGHRVDAIHGDLREVRLEGTFDLITASPPYIPLGKGKLSPHPQRAACRIELRGDIFDYCRAAAAVLAADGVFVFCHAAADPRPEPAIAEAGLALISRREIYFRQGRPASIAIFTCRRPPARRIAAEPVFIRDTFGRWTEQVLAIRREMGARS